MIYLIGGAPRVGKSIAARKLAVKLNGTFVSIDEVCEKYMESLPEAERGVMFPFPGFAGDPAENRFGPEDLVRLQLESAKSLEPEIRRVISTELPVSGPHVIEGVQLLPEFVRSLIDEFGAGQVMAVFVGSNDVERIAKGIADNSSPDNWMRESNPAVIRQVAGFAAAFSTWIKKECGRLGLPYVERTDDFEADMERVVDFMTQGKDEVQNPFGTRPRKNIIIFEGIASSGKTTVEKLVAEKLPGSVILTEGKTLMPLIDNSDPEEARLHLQKLVKEIDADPASTVIVDRFYLTHAFRTQTDLNDFRFVENELRRAGKVTIILLVIDPANIKERVGETIFHRQDAWQKGKQGSLEEKVYYYTKQQEKLVALLGSSESPSITINTTGKEWARYAEEVSRFVSKKAAFEIRKAGLGDIGAISEFQNRLYGNDFDAGHGDLAESVAEGLVWVATDGDRILGYQFSELFGPDQKNFPNSIFLSELYVVPDARDCGVGSSLIAVALREPWPAEYGYFSLTHEPSEAWLTEYYKRFGFVECGKTAAGNVKMTRER